MKRILLLLAVSLAACGGGEVADGPRGVTDTSVRFGMHTDLSSVLASWGVPMANGVRMRFDEANAAGGVHGRQILLEVEDSQYQVPVAVKATNKLINVDGIFAMVSAMGTPQNNAVFEQMFAAGVPSLFPATAARSMAEPLHPMKFAIFQTYRDQARAAVRYMVENEGVSSACLQVIATDYGEEVGIGFDMSVEHYELAAPYTGTHKLSETDFTGTATAIKNAGCDLLVLGPLVKDARLLYSALRDTGWDGLVVGNMVSYTDELIAGASESMQGFMSVSPGKLPDLSDPSQNSEWVRDWIARYEETYGVAPVGQAVNGYNVADLVVRGLENAGRELTLESFLVGLEAITHGEDPFGGPPFTLGPDDHTAVDVVNLYRVDGGKWVTVATEIAF